jgi:L-fuculose-phosphate aldolase
VAHHGLVIDSQSARAAIVAAGARLGARGLIVAAEGNLSVRIGSTILVTPSGRRKDELEPGDILEVPVDAAETPPGSAADGRPRPSSDLAIHRAIYAARPDVAAIAHAHLAAARWKRARQQRAPTALPWPFH